MSQNLGQGLTHILTQTGKSASGQKRTPGRARPSAFRLFLTLRLWVCPFCPVDYSTEYFRLRLQIGLIHWWGIRYKDICLLQGGRVKLAASSGIDNIVNVYIAKHVPPFPRKNCRQLSGILLYQRRYYQTNLW